MSESERTIDSRQSGAIVLLGDKQQIVSLGGMLRVRALGPSKYCQGFGADYSACPRIIEP
eukprot:1190311-Amorphochlora_amoeboformis.AAC.1